MRRITERRALKPKSPFLSELKSADSATWVVLIVATMVLIAGRRWGSVDFFLEELRWDLPSPAHLSAPHVWKYGFAFVAYLLVPLACARLLPGLRDESLGLGLGDVYWGSRIATALLAVMIPATLLASQWPQFARHYPLAAGAATRWDALLVYEVAQTLYYLAWEFLFRGFLLFPLARRYGPTLAILIQTLPFALLHANKPLLESYGSIAAGVALGVLAWRTRSCLWGFFVHAIVGWTMDVAASWSRLR